MGREQTHPEQERTVDDDTTNKINNMDNNDAEELRSRDNPGQGTVNGGWVDKQHRKQAQRELQKRAASHKKHRGVCERLFSVLVGRFDDKLAYATVVNVFLVRSVYVNNSPVEFIVLNSID